MTLVPTGAALPETSRSSPTAHPQNPHLALPRHTAPTARTTLPLVHTATPASLCRHPASTSAELEPSVGPAAKLSETHVLAEVDRSR